MKALMSERKTEETECGWRQKESEGDFTLADQVELRDFRGVSLALPS